MPWDQAGLRKRVWSGEGFSKAEIAALLGGAAASEVLFGVADQVRAEFVGPVVHLRALIEFSNYCRNNCLYCGLRRQNKFLPRYRMAPEEIFRVAQAAAAYGFRTVVLQAGEDGGFPPRLLAEVVRELKALGLTVTLSVGELSREEYALLREAGADRYLLRHETADRKLFAKLKPDTTFERRYQCLLWLQELGYETGAGCIVGLPGQTKGSLADDILLMLGLKVPMAGIGPFIPHSATPLRDASPGSLELTLRVLALTRLVLPTANLPATTATSVAARGGREAALRAGANVIMVNVTPSVYRRHYAIYPGKWQVDKSVDPFAYWRERLKELGRRVS